MKLSNNFTLDELCVTKSGLPNIPNGMQINALRELVLNVLQPLRELYGKPITINSGFRSKEVNKLVGGVMTSQHLKGEAADLDCDDNKKLFELIRDNFTFDQLINEHNYSWVHVSYKKSGNRNQIINIK